MMDAKKLSAAALMGASFFLGSRAEAAPPFVERRLTLPAHDAAFDVGLGIGHYDFGGNVSGVGAGLNLEGAVSVIHHLELGVRDGVRFNNAGVFARGDQYGRLFDRETFGVRGGSVANPELRLRGEVIDSSVIELALEARAYVPIENGSRVGVMLGLPLAFHLGSGARLDTGIYVPFIFYDRLETQVSVPFNAWFQVSPKVWLGPMGGVRVAKPGNRGQAFTELSLGFGLGYQIASFLDFKTMLLVPAVGHTPDMNNVGLGVGLQLRIE